MTPSHLSVIIARVKNLIDMNGEEECSKDLRFIHSVKNLVSYRQNFYDANSDEIKEADELYNKYKHYFK